MKQEIQEHPDNDLIIARILAERLYGARYEKSNKKVCTELGLDYIGVGK